MFTNILKNLSKKMRPAWYSMYALNYFSTLIGHNFWLNQVSVLWVSAMLVPKSLSYLDVLQLYFSDVCRVSRSNRESQMFLLYQFLFCFFIYVTISKCNLNFASGGCKGRTYTNLRDQISFMSKLEPDLFHISHGSSADQALTSYVGDDILFIEIRFSWK